MSIRSIFEDSTAKLLGTLVLLFLLAITVLLGEGVVSLFVRDPYLGYVTKILGALADAMLVAAVIIAGFEVRFRKDLLVDIESIFKSSKNQVFVDTTVYSRHDFQKLISDDVRSCKEGDRVDLIGIAEGSFFINIPGHELLKDQIKNGVHIRCLVLHPESLLVRCIQNESVHYGTPDVVASIKKTATGVIHRLAVELNKSQKTVRGSLEVRMLRDLQSCAHYYSSQTLTIFSPYLAHERGTLCPAFSTSDKHYRAQLGQHFEALWNLSPDNILVKVDRASFIDATSTL
jgi:hypothetical protein